MTNVDKNISVNRPRRMAREPQSTEPQSTEPLSLLENQESPFVANEGTPKRSNKSAVVLGLLERSEGATIEQLMSATGWLPHSTRAALTGLRKKGHAIVSEKVEGIGRIYRTESA